MLVAVTYDLNDGWGEVKEAAFAGPFYNILETGRASERDGVLT